MFAIETKTWFFFYLSQNYQHVQYGGTVDETTGKPGIIIDMVIFNPILNITGIGTNMTSTSKNLTDPELEAIINDPKLFKPDDENSSVDVEFVIREHETESEASDTLMLIQVSKMTQVW
ncbi:hypothetical protein QE152_g37589 [Popillia japonica]|uniref:Uncharacterized protein n=1 Tax=Popillia japonica TaxID=7064 RepID=A0AAW1I9R1_POPJA